MTVVPFLPDVVVVFGTALVVAALSSRVALPPLVAYLVAGALVGPSALGWIGDTQHVEVLAELGVAFILFAIGLELPVERLRRLGSILIAGGGLQIVLTVGPAAAALALAGYGAATTTLYALCIALSSTAVVLRLLQTRRELETPHGRFVTGVLIAQDLLIVPLLVLVPFLAGAEVSPVHVAVQFGGGLAAIAAVFALGRWALPVAFRWIAETRARELLTLAALFLCFGGGLATESLGFSLALGGFLAGVLLADSDYHHQIVAETGPFRDVLASFFFVTVGMLLDVRFVMEHALLVVALALGIVAFKGVVAGGVAWWLGFPLRTTLLAGAALAQVGEFSIVLLRRGHALELVDEWHFQLSIATAVVTMLVTPAALAIAARALRRRPDSGAGAPVFEGITNHVVVVGYGTQGQNLVRVLGDAGLAYVVIDANPKLVRSARARAVRILFGDCTRPEIQRHAGVERASLAVFAVSDPEAARLGVLVARDLRPDLFIVARARSIESIEQLRKAGADVVVVEEFEASIEIVTEVLRRLHIPGNVIRTQARVLRESGYEALRRASTPIPVGDIAQALAGGTSETFLLEPDNPSVGSTLRDLRLRERSGASAVAILRGERVLSNPGPDERLCAGDILVLIGSHAEVERGFDVMSNSVK